MATEFEKQLISLRYWLLGKEYYMAVEAMEFASHYHTGKRKDGVTPEFAHQVALCQFARSISSILLKPEETFAALFLHDVSEDYGVPIATLESKFGTDVSQAVWLLSKKMDGLKKERAYYFEQIGQNPIASLGKGIDRIHNLQTSHVFTPEGQERYADETEEFIIPMLKVARRKFPQQEMGYENIKLVLGNQVALIRRLLSSHTLNTKKTD